MHRLFTLPATLAATLLHVVALDLAWTWHVAPLIGAQSPGLVSLYCLMLTIRLLTLKLPTAGSVVADAAAKRAAGEKEVRMVEIATPLAYAVIVSLILLVLWLFS